jgi:branched-chain amino acid transport system substrate-binding protein
MPSQVHAGTYSAVLHYLKAVKEAGSTDADAVMAKMRELPVDDFAFKGSIRADGQMMHDMYLAQVKTPEESKRPWDYYKILKAIPAEQAFTPAAESKCPLLKKG